ncbi:MAG: thiamine pyrophosphate-binding protein [Thaumarchaeota archaeon]|nr:thiamine pyrophosphate-binding protein [Nitrososphaerota archaeon]
MKPPIKSETTTEAKTGGQLLMKLLQNEAAQFVFGTTGAGLADVQDAMVVVKPPKFIQGLHEFVSVSAACGYCLASGKTGYALIDRVVGTQNAIGALYGAYQNFAAVVVLAAKDVPGIPLEPDAAHYHSDMLQMVKPWVKWIAEIQSIEGLALTFEKALFMANSEPTGPAFITLRRDLMSRQIERGPTQKVSTPRLSARVPEDNVLEKIADEISSHPATSLVVSHIGRAPKAVESLIKFAHASGSGVIERRYFMSYPVTDPLHVNFFYIRKPPTLNQLLKKGDLAILLETGLSANQKLPEGLDVIDLSSDPLHRQDLPLGGDDGSMMFPALLRVACDLGPTLTKLTNIIETRSTSETRKRVSERIVELTENHAKQMTQRREKAKESFASGKLDSWSIGYVINKHLTESMIWVNGTPILTYTPMIETVEITRPGSYFGNPSTHVGVTVGMGYGAALADREYVNVESFADHSIGRLSESSRTVLCCIGDGEAIFGNLDSALWTCKHYGLGVVYIVFNNSCWGIDAAFIEHASQHWAKSSQDFEFVDIDAPSIDFVHLGKAFGVQTYSVSDAPSFDFALGKAIAESRGGEPGLIELKLEKFTGSAPSSIP